MTETTHNEPTAKFGTGLRETPPDPRDISLGGVYGCPDINEVPLTDWDVATPKVIKDQGQTDFCGGYSVSSISEDQEDTVLSGVFQFAAIKKLEGDFRSWGCDLRQAVKSTVDVGSVPIIYEEALKQSFPNASRDFLADWKNWPASCFMIAEGYKKGSFWTVNGPYDAFDNVRAHMWNNREDKSTVSCGVIWKYLWNNVDNGVIPSIFDGNGEGHAIKIFGQKMINGIPYLKIQNSWGLEPGDHGIFYVNREIFNAYFANFGLYMLKDLPKDVAKFLAKNDLTIKSAWWAKLYVAIKGLFTRYAQSFAQRG